MNKNTEVKWPEYRVIEVENSLGTKAIVPGNANDAIARATKRAEAAVQRLSADFPTWMRAESDRLYEIRNEIAREGASNERIDRLFTCAHDIRGQAQTYGYPVAAYVGKLLCDLFEYAHDPRKIPLPVIDQHVDTIRAIVRQDLKGDGNTQTNNIIKGLHALNHTALAKIAKNQRSAEKLAV